MADDWDLEDEPANSGSSTPAQAAAPPKPAGRSRWADEDKDEEQDDWDASEDEKPKAVPGVGAPAAKKKMTLKQKLAEKERLATESKLQNGGDDDLMDTMTTQEKRRIAREREIEADMAAASELMGSTGVDDSPETLQSILTAKPSSKDAFTALSSQIISVIISRHESNPLYAAFAEQLAKDLCGSLNAVQTRKVSSMLSVLGNTKQQEERDKASGKKKTANKPKLGAAKTINKADTEAYEDILDDGDFM